MNVRTQEREHDEEVGSDRLEQFVDQHPGVVRLARAGWAAKGVVYLLTGVLAFTVAASPFDDSGTSGTASGQQADPTGAVATIAEQPFGTALLWVLAIGLFLYSAWRLFTVVLPADIDAHAVLRRVGYTVSAAIYIALGVTAVSLAGRSGSSGGSQDSRISSASRTVMEWTGGRWIVGIAGLVVIGIGVYFAWKGIAASFVRQLEHRSVGPFSWQVVRAMGRIGWVGRAVMMWLVGFFVTRAAIQFDPDDARGLDDSLRRAADSTLGTALVIVVAVGLVLYGAFCVVSAPARRLVASDDD